MDNQNNGEYDQSAAQDAGYAAGRVGRLRQASELQLWSGVLMLDEEGEYNDARQDVRQDEQ